MSPTLRKAITRAVLNAAGDAWDAAEWPLRIRPDAALPRRPYDYERDGGIFPPYPPPLGRRVIK